MRVRDLDLHGRAIGRASTEDLETMKTLAALALAAALAAGTVSTANAFGIYSDPAYDTEQSVHVDLEGTVHDHCHGMSSGHAHPLCGTATGGPAGGLF